jgi:hypothetical protein
MLTGDNSRANIRPGSSPEIFQDIPASSYDSSWIVPVSDYSAPVNNFEGNNNFSVPSSSFDASSFSSYDIPQSQVPSYSQSQAPSFVQETSSDGFWLPWNQDKKEADWSWLPTPVRSTVEAGSEFFHDTFEGENDLTRGFQTGLTNNMDPIAHKITDASFLPVNVALNAFELWSKGVVDPWIRKPFARGIEDASEGNREAQIFGATGPLGMYAYGMGKSFTDPNFDQGYEDWSTPFKTGNFATPWNPTGEGEGMDWGKAAFEIGTDPLTWTGIGLATKGIKGATKGIELATEVAEGGLSRASKIATNQVRNALRKTEGVLDDYTAIDDVGQVFSKDSKGLKSSLESIEGVLDDAGSGKVLSSSPSKVVMSAEDSLLQQQRALEEYAAGLEKGTSKFASQSAVSGLDNPTWYNEPGNIAQRIPKSKIASSLER